MIAQDSALAISAGVRSGSLSASDVWQDHWRRLRAAEPAVQAFVDLGVTAEVAGERAASLDRRRRRGEPLGSLAGVPVAIKDNLAVAGQPLRCGSRLLDGYVAPSHATVVDRLLAADAVLIGKTRLDEFAMGSSCETSVEGPTHNPWDRERVAGGSSGGSAAAVATGLPLALGSDTGGSIRLPAAFCGTVGLRPTYGRVSRRGLVGFAPSLDQVGPLATSVRDAALVLTVIAGHDPRDATSSRQPSADFVDLGSESAEPLVGLRIGVPIDLDLDTLASGAVVADFERAIERLTGLGATRVDVSIPDLDAAVACYHLLAAAEASTTLARFDGVRYGRRETADSLEGLHVASRSKGFGREVKRRILLGTFALSADQAATFRRRVEGFRRTLRHHLSAALATADVVVTPTAPSAAFRLGELLDNPIALHTTDAFTAPASLAGLPALSVPSGVDRDGLPLGLQVIGRAFDEATVLRVGQAFETVTELPTCPLRRELGL